MNYKRRVNRDQISEVARLSSSKNYRIIVYHCDCGIKLGDCNFSRFGFIVQTETNRLTYRDAAERLTHATVVGVSNYRGITNNNCLKVHSTQNFQHPALTALEESK